MSNGPIQRDRDAHVSPVVSNGSRKDVVHGLVLNVPPTNACGRKGGVSSMLLAKVTCADCLAARQADAEASLKRDLLIERELGGLCLVCGVSDPNCDHDAPQNHENGGQS